MNTHTNTHTHINIATHSQIHMYVGIELVVVLATFIISQVANCIPMSILGPQSHFYYYWWQFWADNKKEQLQQPY